jgi:hypothetical protein
LNHNKVHRRNALQQCPLSRQLSWKRSWRRNALASLDSASPMALRRRYFGKAYNRAIIVCATPKFVVAVIAAQGCSH